MKYAPIAAVLFLVFALAAQASIAAETNPNMGESFAEPNYKELSQTMVMMDAVDISDPAVAEEYSKMMYCDLWRQNHKNDFDWNKIRQMVISRAMGKKDYYRIQYQIGGTIFLDKYNFETQDFPLTAGTALNRVGSMVLLEYNPRDLRGSIERGVRPLCDDLEMSSVFPSNYILVMNQPFTFDRLKVPMDDAKLLLDKMEAAKNFDRRLFVRFRFRVQSIERMPKSQNKEMRRVRVVAHGELIGVDIFLDSAMTQYLTSVSLKQ